MALQAAAVCWDRLQAALFCPNCSKCLDAHISKKYKWAQLVSCKERTVLVTMLNCNFQRFTASRVPRSQAQNAFGDKEFKAEGLAALCSCLDETLSGGVLLIGTTVSRDKAPLVSQDVSPSQATNPADSGGWKWWQHTVPPTAKTKNNYLYSTHHKTTHFTEKHRRKAWHTCFSAIVQPVAWVQLDTSRCAESAQIPLFAVWSQTYKVLRLVTILLSQYWKGTS